MNVERIMDKSFIKKSGLISTLRQICAGRQTWLSYQERKASPMCFRPGSKVRSGGKIWTRICLMHRLDPKQGVVIWESCYWLYDLLRGQPKKKKKIIIRSQKMKVGITTDKYSLLKSPGYIYGKATLSGCLVGIKTVHRRRSPKITRCLIHSLRSTNESSAISQAQFWSVGNTPDDSRN